MKSLLFDSSMFCQMHCIIQRTVLVCTALLASTLCAQTAFADSCENLEGNEKYTNLVQKMNKQLKAESYEDALKTVHQILDICPSLPSSNYVAGKIYQKLNDNKKAASYYRKAIENTNDYVVDKDLVKSMWFARYEAEHPDVMACKTDTLDEFYQQPLYDYAETIMWTGTGLGAAGVILTIVGGAIMATQTQVDSVSQQWKPGPGQQNNDKTENSMTGSILLGVGIGATVAGAVTAGFGGYQYAKLKAEKEEKVSVAFNVSYNHIGLSMTF